MQHGLLTLKHGEMQERSKFFVAGVKHVQTLPKSFRAHLWRLPARGEVVKPLKG